MNAISIFGLLPDGWALGRLCDLTSKIGSGATPRGGEAAYLASRDNFALIRSQCVHDRRFDKSKLSFIDDEQAKQLRNAEVRSGDVLLNITGDGVTFSRSALVPDDVLPACVNQHVAIIRAETSLLSPKFLVSFLTHPLAKPYIEAFNAGGSRRAITKGHIESFEIPLPPVDEQIAIGEFLSRLDDKIELNRRMNETLEEMALAIFKDWFVDFGPTRRKQDGATDPVTILGGLLPDPAKAEPVAALFPDRFGDDGLPEGWEERPLDEIADFLNGLALQKFPAKAAEDSLPVIKIAELRGGITSNSNRASRDLPSKYIIRNGDFVFSWSGSLMAKFWTEGEGALNQHLFKVTSECYPAWFFSQWVHHHLEEFQSIAASKATTMGHIQRGHLKAAMTVDPGAKALEVMGKAMEPLLQLAIQNDIENQTLAAMRDLLLPKLMSGEVRLKDVEAIA